MPKRSATLAVLVTTLAVSLSACAEHRATSQAQGKVNYQALKTAMDNEPDEAGRLSDLGKVTSGDVTIVNAAAISRGENAPQLTQDLRNNATNISDLRNKIDRHPSLKQVLSERQVPVDTVVAMDVDPAGPVVVYTMPNTQAGAVPGQSAPEQSPAGY